MKSTTSKGVKRGSSKKRGIHLKENNIIHGFQQYSSWVSTLNEIDGNLWTTSIAEGKWAIREIIVHITKWDEHIISQVLPSVRNDGGMIFPEFDSFNKAATEYAKSGISQLQLLEEASETRERLVKELHEMPIEKLTKSLTANGASHCPHTGTPYSLIYIVKEFSDHDHHHKRQIEQFLNNNS